MSISVALAGRLRRPRRTRLAPSGRSLPTSPLLSVPPDDEASGGLSDWGETCTAQVVEHFTPLGTLRHLKVRRHDGRSGIPWAMLQEIKDEMLGPEVMAVELYPPRNRVVNEANIRHLWEVPEDLIPFGLSRRD
jgi:hypothetical protein